MSTISASATNYHDGGTRFLSNDQNNKAQNNDAISHNALEEPKNLRKGSPEAREHLRKIKSLFYQFQEKSKEITRAVDLELSDKYFSEITSTVLWQVHLRPEIVQLRQQKLELKDALVLELKKAGVDIKSPKRLSLDKLKEKIDLAVQNLRQKTSKRTSDNTDDEVSEGGRNRRSQEILRAALPSWRNTRSSSAFI